jgi:hypothetical protein
MMKAQRALGRLRAARLAHFTAGRTLLGQFVGRGVWLSGL